MSQIHIQGRGKNTETPYFMGEFTHLERQTFANNQFLTWDNTTGMSFDTMLVYVSINKHGVKIYVDPLNRSKDVGHSFSYRQCRMGQ